MKKKMSKMIIAVGFFVMALMGAVTVNQGLAQPVYAENDNTESCTCTKPDGTIVQGTKTKTAILGNGTETGCECGKGEGVISILSFVVNILTIGVAILGMIGITIVGIQYITAGGSEEKTRKAKRRMFEIVLGLAAYVVVYALLSWLIPGFTVGL